MATLLGCGAAVVASWPPWEVAGPGPGTGAV